MNMKIDRRVSAISIVAFIIVAAVLGAAPTREIVRPRTDVKMARPSRTVKARLAAAHGKLPLAFEPNRGQTDARVKFLARGDYTLFLTKSSAVLDFPVASRESKGANKNRQASSRFDGPLLKQAPQSTNSVLQMRLLGVNRKAAIGGEDELPGKSNYFIGNDPKKWRTDVPQYARVKYSEIYPGVNLVYYGNQSGELEYDFQVAPGEDPKAITFEVATDKETKQKGRVAPNPSLRLDAHGDLLVKLAGGEVRFHKPVVYQPVSGEETGNAQKKFITGRYLLTDGNRVRFAIAGYDKSKPLIIDPSLVYSSLIGGSNTDSADAIAVDGSGSVYLTGHTLSTDFPRANQIPGACNGNCGTGTTVAFVTKINAAGSALVYSSLLGGSNGDAGNAIAVDASGNAYLTGVTSSVDFPRVNQIPGACNGTCGTGKGNAFVTKINAVGTALVYSSLLGGSATGFTHWDGGYGIAVDGSGNVYLTGQTYSPDFPRVNQIPGACNGTCGTGLTSNAFITKVNMAGSALSYSSYIGGSGNTNGAGEAGYGIAVDGFGNAYLTGSTSSANFPVVNQMSGACNGSCGDGNIYVTFVTKVNAAGTALDYSSYVGGSGGSGRGDSAVGIALDGSGNAYLAGTTGSPDFPRVNQIPGVCNGTCGSGINEDGDVFVTKVNSAGSALAYSSVIGGSVTEYGTGVSVDSSGNAYLTGSTDSTDFPIVNPIQDTCNGTCGTGTANAFVIKIESTGNALVYSSLIGGSTGENGTGIAVDSSSNVYLTGFTQSTDFPILNQIPGACNGTCGTERGNQDAYVTKISAVDTALVNLFPASLSFGPQGAQNMNVPQYVTLTNIGQLPLSIASIGVTGQNNGDFTETNNCPLSPAKLGVNGSCKIMVVFAPQESGTLNASISIADNAPGSPQSVSLTGVGVSGRPRMGAPSRP
jgi:Beta-propeller repeat